MSWWNDLSTHRSGATAEASLRAQSGSGYCFQSDTGANSSTTGDVCVQSSCNVGPKTNPNALGFSSVEVPKGSDGADRSEAGSLWQTANSFGDVAGSDQLGASSVPSVWGSPIPHQQPMHASFAALPQPPLTLSPPLPPAEPAVVAALSVKHRARSSFANSGSSSIYSSGCGAADRPGHTMDDYGPSSVSGNTYGEPQSRTVRDDDTYLRAMSVSGRASITAAVATSAAGSMLAGGMDSSDDNGSDTVRTGDVKCSEAVGDGDFDEVDVGTISSLIASLQHHHSTRGAAATTAITGGDAADGDDDEEDEVQDGTNRGSGGDAATSGPLRHSSQSSCGTERIASSAAHYNPYVGCAPLRTSRSSSGTDHARRQGEYGPNDNNTSASGRDLYDLSIQDPVPGAAASTAAETATPAPATTPAPSPLRLVSMAPLEFPTSSLHNVLASFQSALLERSADGAGNGGVGVGVGGPSLSSLAAVTAGNTASLSGAGQVLVRRAGSPTPPEEWGSQGKASPACGPAVSGTRNSSGSGMRGKVNSVVAHKLNLDSAARRSQMLQQQQQMQQQQQDARAGSAFSVSISSLDSTGSSEMFAATCSLPGRSTLPLPLPSSLLPQVPASTPDSSVDRPLAHTMSIVPGMLLCDEPTGSSATEEVLASVPQHQHQHQRTESGNSLPAAAATYNGGSAAQQRVDAQGCITVVDPQRRKLHVPVSAIQPTKALNGRLKTPSLCLLYQSGRCRQGDNCYQVHLDPAAVERLRADVESMPCCCLQHGDCNSFLVDRSTYEGRSLGIAGQFSVPLTRIAYTVGLQRVLQEEQACAPVNPSLLCRLHGQPGGCRFGADCKFVHVCCQILQNELAGIVANATAAAAAAASAATTTSTNSMTVSTTLVGSPHQQPYQVSGLTGTTPAIVHSHTSSSVSAGNSTVTVPLQAGAAATLIPRPVMTFSPDFAASPSITVLPPTLSQQQQQYQLTSNGAPLMVEVLHGGLIPSNAVHDSPQNTFHNTAGGPAGQTMVSFHSTGVSPLASAARAAPAVSPMNANFGNLVQLTNSQQQKPPSSTPSSVTLQPLVRHAPSGSGGNSAAPYTLTAIHSWQLQGSLAQGSAATAVAGRPSPIQTSSMPGSPSTTSHPHLRTMSTQSTGPFHPYASPPLSTPLNYSGTASPINIALSASRAPGGTPQRQMPPQPPTPPQRFVQVSQGQHPSASGSQQFFVQQVNTDGSISLVPVSLMSSFGATM